MNKLTLNVEFDFAASHFLTKYKGKCERMHGHNYKLIVTVKDTIKEDDLVMDFKKIKEVVKENVIEKLDHYHLNDIIENPSAERICIWIWEHLKNDLPLKKLTLYETDNCSCEYEGE